MEGLKQQVQTRLSKPLPMAEAPQIYQPQPQMTPYPRGIMGGIVDAARVLGSYAQAKRFDVYRQQQMAKAEADDRLKFYKSIGLTPQQMLQDPAILKDIETLTGRPWPTTEVTRQVQTGTEPVMEGIPYDPRRAEEGSLTPFLNMGVKGGAPAVPVTGTGPGLEQAGIPEPTTLLPTTPETFEQIQVGEKPVFEERKEQVPLMPGAGPGMVRDIMLKDPLDWTVEEAQLMQKVFGSEAMAKLYGITDVATDAGDTPLGEVIPNLPAQYAHLANVPIKYAGSILADIAKQPGGAEWLKSTRQEADNVLKNFDTATDPTVRKALARRYNELAWYLNQAGMRLPFIQPGEIEKPLSDEQILRNQNLKLANQRLELLNRATWKELSDADKVKTSDVVAAILAKVRDQGVASLSAGERELWNQYIVKTRDERDGRVLAIRELSMILSVIGDPVKVAVLKKQPGGQAQLDRWNTRIPQLMDIIESETGVPTGDATSIWIDEQIAAGVSIDSIRTQVEAQGYDPDDYPQLKRTK